jgi:hypothetical protein
VVILRLAVAPAPTFIFISGVSLRGDIALTGLHQLIQTVSTIQQNEIH